MGIKDLSKDIYGKADGKLTDRLMIAIDEVRNEDKVLEIGVGSGVLIRNIGQYKKVSLYAIDVSEQALKNIEKYLKDSQLVDISNERLKFEDDTFDTVICLEVFEHLQNPYHALTEIRRILKPGGKLILSIPNYLGGHLMIYPGLITPKFFRLFLKQNYFKISKFFLWGSVLNKDNVGKLIKYKVKNRLFSFTCLILIQVMMRFFQIITKLFCLKITVLYWCYFFICENKKDLIHKPFWLKQLEQTTELGDNIGWYHRRYH